MLLQSHNIPKAAPLPLSAKNSVSLFIYLLRILDFWKVSDKNYMAIKIRLQLPENVHRSAVRLQFYSYDLRRNHHRLHMSVSAGRLSYSTHVHRLPIVVQY